MSDGSLPRLRLGAEHERDLVSQFYSPLKPLPHEAHDPPLPALLPISTYPPFTPLSDMSRPTSKFFSRASVGHVPNVSMICSQPFTRLSSLLPLHRPVTMKPP